MKHLKIINASEGHAHQYENTKKTVVFWRTYTFLNVECLTDVTYSNHKALKG